MLFWNASILAVCLLGFCAFFHELLKVRLLSLVDTQLSERSNALIRLWKSIPQVAQDALRDELDGGRFGSTMFIPEQSPDSADTEPPRPDDSLTGIYRPRAFTPEGRTYFRGVHDSMLDVNAFRRASKGETVHSTVTIHGGLVRVISVPVIVDGDLQFVLQSARGLTEYEADLRAVTADLLRAIPFLLLLAAAGGWVLTNRAMRPVRQLREATEHIEAQDLSRRLPVVGSDEFTLLTETLNHMLERLDNAFAQQARFIADASHELRTPLTILRGNTSLALTGEREASDYRSTIERAHRTIASMSRLVDELLLLSRADSGQMLHAGDHVDVGEAVNAAVEATPGRDTLPISVSTITAGITVNGNRELLVRLFANLLNNAVRHTESDSPITISIHHDAEAAIVIVEDSGEGISPEHLVHVMERFYRSDTARSGHEGSGLGLAICKSIVTAHGGTIEIASRVGSGTSVTVRIPIAN
jgi:heavy metal sensor kinase